MANTITQEELLLNSLMARPAEGSFLTSTRGQAAIAVIDTSASMKGEKITEASVALGELVRELRRPENKGRFELAVVEYGSTAGTTLELRKAADVEPDAVSLEVGRFGNGTNLTAALKAAEEVVLAALGREVKQLRPVVVLLTDGQHNAGSDPLPVARRLGERADLVCVAFGADADEAGLLQIASRPELVTRAQKGPELRTFFAQVGTSMRRSSTRGSSLVQELCSNRRVR